MSRFQSSSWSYRVDLSSSDKINLRSVITAERDYFNALVGGLNGPIRTMPDTLKNLTGKWEDIIGLIAETNTDIRKLKVDALGRFEPFKDMLFENNRLKVDSKTQVFLDVVLQYTGAVNPLTRRNLAIEMIKYAREQSANLAMSLNREDQVYKFAIETIVPLDANSKRHIQLPRAAVTVEEIEVDGEKQQQIAIPYLAHKLTVGESPLVWNYLILREDTDGRHTLEVCKENALYMLKKTDRSQFRKKRPQRERA